MSTASKPIVLGLKPSFGFGDRLGIATPGHLAALRREGGDIKGMFAQQSIREMARTQRTPDGVMGDARRALDAEGFDDICGADADHLKTREDVDRTANAGFVFYTIDPSDAVDQEADDYDADQVASKFSAIEAKVAWVPEYLGKTVNVPDGPEIHFDQLTVHRAAVKYGKAIVHALSLAETIREKAESLGADHEIELSVDETEQPTTLAEHYIIADQMRRANVRLVSLAPRFIGDFEKGVDFKGNVEALEFSLRNHAAVARALGPYKLSLHSGSDKLSMYAPFARATRGLFHVKTAGTSYLEAVRVAARHDEPLFRRIVDFARKRYDVDKATYHVSATVAGVPAPSEISDVATLEKEYLECWDDVPEGKGFTKPGRQILHCTFGSVLTDNDLGGALRKVLADHAATYTELLADHFGRHLRALRAGMA